MHSYLIVLNDIKTGKPITTLVIEAETDLQACIIGAAYADANGYELGDIVRRD
jgi:hypothetical protein